MKVIATHKGFYGAAYRNPGDSFTLKDKKDFSAKWMKEAPKQEAKPVAPVKPA